MTRINFDASPDDALIIRKIAKRAMSLVAARRSDPFTAMDIAMDVTAVHLNDGGLRLKDLFAADDFNFAHDILGIRRHLDRETGKLTGFFCPRFARPEPDPTILAAG